jgi:hypothetical protein
MYRKTACLDRRWQRREQRCEFASGLADAIMAVDLKSGHP